MPGETIALEPRSPLSLRPTGRRTDFEVSLLGPVTVFRSGAPVRMGAEKHRMIVAALALRRGRGDLMDALVDVLWGARPPQTAQKALQVYVSSFVS